MSSFTTASWAHPKAQPARRSMSPLRIGVNTRMRLAVGALLLLLPVACAGSQPSPAAAEQCASEGRPPGFEPPGQTKALPRYFTLELAGTETRVDGQPLRGHDLSVRIDTEAKDPDNGGALIRLEPEFSGEVLGAIVWELSTAGFAHIIVWRKQAGESEEPALEPPAQGPSKTAGVSDTAGSVESEPAESRPTAPSPDPPTASSVGVVEPPAPDASADASVRTIGLHVGGGPNDDETRGKFIAPIEKQFDGLLRCHARAEKRDRNASVGVDLLIPAGGGRARVQDLRTALKGDAFKTCVQGILEKVEFPSVSRATVVSYSMLFEPIAKR